MYWYQKYVKADAMSRIYFETYILYKKKYVFLILGAWPNNVF